MSTLGSRGRPFAAGEIGEVRDVRLDGAFTTVQLYGDEERHSSLQGRTLSGP